MEAATQHYAPQQGEVRDDASPREARRGASKPSRYHVVDAIIKQLDPRLSCLAPFHPLTLNSAVANLTRSLQVLPWARGKSEHAMPCHAYEVIL